MDAEPLGARVLNAKRLYGIAAAVSAAAFAAAFAGGLAFSVLSDGRLPAPDLDYMPHLEDLAEEQRWEELTRELRAAAVLQPSAPVLELLARTAGETADHESELLALRRLVRRDGGNAELRLRLSRALLASAQQGDGPPRRHLVHLAMRNAEVALDIDPGSAPAHRTLGEAWLLLGDRVEADRHFAEARHFDPGPPRPPLEAERLRAGEGS